MKDIQIDTAQVIEALKVFFEFESIESTDTEGHYCSMIDFVSQLISREKVYFDGKVHGAQKEVLERLLEKAYQVNEKLKNKLVPIVPDDSYEEALALDAGCKSAVVADTIAKKYQSLAKYIRLYDGIKGTDKLSNSLRENLLPHFYGRGPDPDCVLNDKKIIGRRYIFGIAKNIESLDKVRESLPLDKYDENEIIFILRLIFNYYRAELARNRENYLLCEGVVTKGKYFYKPTPQRERFLSFVCDNHHDYCEFEEGLDKDVESSWMKVNFDGYDSDNLVPLPFNMALSIFKNRKAATRSTFLNEIVEYSMGGEALKLRYAHSMLPGGLISGDSKNFSEEILNKFEIFSGEKNCGDLYSGMVEKITCSLSLYLPVDSEYRRVDRIAKMYHRSISGLLKESDVRVIFKNVFMENIPDCKRAVK